MSDARHTVTAGDSLIGAGKRPAFTPAHQVDLLTGTRGGIPRLGSPITCLRRRNDSFGRVIGNSIELYAARVWIN